MNSRGGQQGSGPPIYVGPDGQFGSDAAGSVREAVECGGGRVVSEPKEVEAIVWLGSPSGLSEVLHESVRWVQLPSAGVESWLDPANNRLPSAVVTERAFEFVLPSRAREPRTVMASPCFNEVRVQP